MTAVIEDWHRFERILCVRPDNVGDVLMTTPALRALKHARPGRHITLLTSSAGAAIARNVPEIDDVIVFDPPWYRHAAPGDRVDLDAAVTNLHSREFDGAVIFTVFSQNPLPTAMLCYQAGIRRIAGYCRENPYALMTDWLPDAEPLDAVRHEVQRQLDLATALGAVPEDSSLSLRVPHERMPDVEAVLRAAGVDCDAPWIVMHPGASEARRRYSPSGFADAARALRHRLGVQVVLAGDASERSLADDIAGKAGEGVFSLAGQLDLDTYVAMLARASLLISNNTGPVHIAAAVGTPVVVLYAATNPQHTPWRVPNRVLTFDIPESEVSRNVIVRHARKRFFCGAPSSISPEDIVAAAVDLMPSNASRDANVTQRVFHMPEVCRVPEPTAVRPG